MPINRNARKPAPQPKKQMAPQTQKETPRYNYELQMFECIDGSKLVGPSLQLVLGGAALTSTGILIRRGESTPWIAAGVGITMANLGMAAYGISKQVQTANKAYDLMVSAAATERRTAEIFEAILTSKLYKGAKSFELIVDGLEGISDADRASLKSKYMDYQAKCVNAAAENAKTEAASQHQQPTEPVQPPQPEAAESK